MLLDRKFIEDFKNVVKTVIFLLQEGFTFTVKQCSKVEKTGFRKVLLQYSIQNVLVRFMTVILTVVT